MPTDVFPGMEGEIRVSYWTQENRSETISTDWESVSKLSGYIFQFRIDNLESDALYS